MPIEDPSGRALTEVRAALREARAGRGVARVVFYGASHTALDQYPSGVRAALEARMPRASSGVILPIRPPWSYDTTAAAIESGGEWEHLRVRRSTDPVDDLGVRGHAAETRGVAWARIAPPASTGPTSQVSAFTVTLLGAPDGGRIDLLVDGAPVRTISTEAPSRRALVERVDVARGFHTLELRTRGDGRVRLFGVEMLYGATGVAVDSFGVPGARARSLLRWSPATLEPELRRLRPALVSLAFGTNEAADPDDLVAYERDLGRVVARMRTAAPGASCLLMGPSDRIRPRRGGGWVSLRRIPLIIEIQRRVAAAAGCGFFDVAAFMGGPLSMVRWMEAGLAASDGVHLGDTAHRELADTLVRALDR